MHFIADFLVSIYLFEPARGKKTWRDGFLGSDLLESILSVLFQFTEEGDFKLVPDEQQLGTRGGGGGEVMRRGRGRGGI